MSWFHQRLPRVRVIVYERRLIRFIVPPVLSQKQDLGSRVMVHLYHHQHVVYIVVGHRSLMVDIS